MQQPNLLLENVRNALNVPVTTMKIPCHYYFEHTRPQEALRMKDAVLTVPLFCAKNVSHASFCLMPCSTAELYEFCITSLHAENITGDLVSY